MTPETDPQSFLETALREQVAAGCPGAILEVNAPKFGFAFSGAQGLFARNTSRHLRAEDAFRIASVTKAVTAAAAVCLASRYRWDLDDPIAPLLPPRVVEHLRRLKGLTSVHKITIRCSPTAADSPTTSLISSFRLE